MSRLFAAIWLLLTAVSGPAQVYGPPAPRVAAKTPVQALNGQYDDRYGPRGNGRPCRVRAGEDIVVCGDAAGTSSPYRVPLPDDRHAMGDRVRHIGEAPLATRSTAHCNRPGCAEPSKLMETLMKVITAVKGEEPR